MTSSTHSEQHLDETEQSHQLNEVVDDAVEHAEGEQVRIGQLLDTIQSRGYGPLLLIPSLISISPLGAIPGMSMVTGSLIILIASQMIFRPGHPWIPHRLEEFRFPKQRLEGMQKKASPWLKWLDTWIHERWTFLSVGPMHYVLAALMILTSVTYFPLAFVPLGVMIPGLTNTLLSVGITTRDGGVICVGLLSAGASAVALFLLWPW